MRPFWRESTSSEEMGRSPLSSQTEQYTEVDITPQAAEREGKHEEMKTSHSEVEEQATTERAKTMHKKRKMKRRMNKYLSREILMGKKVKKPVISSTRTHKKPNW